MTDSFFESQNLGKHTTQFNKSCLTPCSKLYILEFGFTLYNKWTKGEAMKQIIILSLIFMLALNIFADEKKKSVLKVGDNAPDFKLMDDAGNLRSLSEFKGKKVVVYFYPKDDTPGCTKEACSFRDSYDIFSETGIIVLGISYDDPESHKKFKEKYNLPFILLSDEKKETAKAYGAYQMIVAKRMTFLIDETGKIVNIFDKVSVTEHAHEVLEAFSETVKQPRIEK